MEKLKIDLPIIVEGKYDKIKIHSIADACVIATDGFGVFKNSERLAIIKRLAQKSKIIPKDLQLLKDLRKSQK